MAGRQKTVPDTRRTGGKVWLYLVLLTLQYGAQPLITKRFVGRGVIVTSSVLACEAAKVICALLFLVTEGSLRRICKEWTLIGSLTSSALPAAIYALQNSLLQISYKNLDSLAFSMLNQTKLFFTALFTYLLLGQKQSVQQIGALILLIFSAVLLSIGEGSAKYSDGNNLDRVWLTGIIPVLVASVFSGLASSLCQWASQVKKHSSYLMTIEMSLIGGFCLLASTYSSPDGEAIRQYGFFHGWTALTLYSVKMLGSYEKSIAIADKSTGKNNSLNKSPIEPSMKWNAKRFTVCAIFLIPIVSNALGGILVGLVTTYAGGVRKGFVIVLALIVTALLQFIFDGKPPSVYCLIAFPLVLMSVSIYQKYPYRIKRKES